MKKIAIIIGSIIVVIILIIAGKKYLFAPKTEDIVSVPTPTVSLPTVSPNVAVELTPRADKRAVSLVIKGFPSDIDSIEYELTYTTGAGLPRGVLGKIAVNGANVITRNDIVLGTCSSGKCAYDSGVTSLNLSLKFNSPQGSSVFQKTYTL